MFLSTLGLKSDGMITETVRAQRQSYDGVIATFEDRRGSHPPLNKCDVEVIRLDINSYNPSISHYKRKNVPIKRYRNPDLSIKEMYKNFSETDKTINFVIKHTVTFLNLEILVFHNLNKTSLKFASTTKTTSKILITTLINVQNA